MEIMLQTGFSMQLQVLDATASARCKLTSHFLIAILKLILKGRSPNAFLTI